MPYYVPFALVREFGVYISRSRPSYTPQFRQQAFSSPRVSPTHQSHRHGAVAELHRHQLPQGPCFISFGTELCRKPQYSRMGASSQKWVKPEIRIRAWSNAVPALRFGNPISRFTSKDRRLLGGGEEGLADRKSVV